MTQKDKAEHKRLTRRILLKQKVTRKQVLRAFELQRTLDWERAQS